ncbi:MAG TPA: DUF397 domain-containing protein [Streptosporangiaceae bacterium]|nr:DUF397 domain-containing protein [Streptosporangiaceae bacterium]
MSDTRPEAVSLQWRKASRSAANGECVEIASTARYVAIRDSKNPDGDVLACAPETFRALLDAVKNGGFRF